MASQYWFVLVFLVLLAVAFLAPLARRSLRRRPDEVEEREAVEVEPAEVAAEAPSTEVIAPPSPSTKAAEPELAEPELAEPEIERPEPTAGRLVRLRQRLARSQSVVGRGLLALLARDKLDDDAWDELEETLISADVGVEATREIVEKLRSRARVLGSASATEVRGLLAEELVEALDP